MRALFVAILVSSLLVLGASAKNTAVVITDMTGARVAVSDTSRIVALGSSLTETVYALGAGKNLIAVDATSNFPAAAKQLVQLPSARSATLEPILQQKPSLVLALDTALPETIAGLRQFGVPTVVLRHKDELENTQSRIRLVAEVLGLPSRGEELVRRLQKELALAKSLYSSLRTRPKVMFLYSGANGRITVSGRETAANAIIGLAGGRNPFVGYTGYAPLSQEATLLENPDVVLMTSLGWAGVGGAEGLLQLPGIANTSAGRGKRFLAFDGNYLLGFGPRTGQAVLELMYALHPSLKKQ
jgi:iron complex transport system substrate-binding protein